jgi:hypothetical protein
MITSYLEKFTLPDDIQIASDSRFAGRIKWYIHPLVFGGDPNSGDNLWWATHDQHGELVVWWNVKYREASGV